jgi:hypothetical protein
MAGNYFGGRGGAPMQQQRAALPLLQQQRGAMPMQRPPMQRPQQPAGGGMGGAAMGGAMANAFGGTQQRAAPAPASYAARPTRPGYAAAQPSDYQRAQQRPQGVPQRGAAGAMLSDERSKTGIKNYNADDGQDWRDTLEKYSSDDPEKKESSGGIGSMIGGMLSDKHSKGEIQRLEGANDALTRALSSSAAYPNTAAPSAGMQALGQQQSAPPSHASFPDSAQTVMAQNQAMAPPPQANPFAVNMQRPNLDELDEAHRRLGQGG